MSFDAIPTILQAILEQSRKNGELLERLYADSVSVTSVAAAEAYTEQKAITAEQKVEAPAPQPEPETVKESLPVAPAAEPIAYADVSKLILKVSSTKGRDAAVAILNKFGAANLKEVKPEQYAEVVAAANEALA